MIVEFAEASPEEVRTLFVELFDESEDIYTRINSFKQKSNILLKNTELMQCNIISTRMQLALIFGFVIQINIISINLAKLRLFQRSLKVITFLKEVLMRIIFVISSHYIMKFVKN